MLDTGADRSTIFSRYGDAHPQELRDRGLGESMNDAFPFINDFSGVGGTVDYRPLQVGPVVVSGWSFPKWLFEMTQNAPSFELEDYDGLIGQDFLRNFDVYLDIIRTTKSIWFQTIGFALVGEASSSTAMSVRKVNAALPKRPASPLTLS